MIGRQYHYMKQLVIDLLHYISKSLEINSFESIIFIILSTSKLHFPFQLQKVRCHWCNSRGGTIYYNGEDRCENDKKCFPSLSKVNLANGKSVRMSELQTGDKVQSGMQFNFNKIYFNKSGMSCKGKF